MKYSFSFAKKIIFLQCIFTAVFALAVVFVFFRYWFPIPFDALMGGRHLLVLILSGLVACGPGLAVLILKSNKQRRELCLDVMLVTGIQLSVLAYGLHVANTARPRAVVYEVDRFVAVSMAAVNLDYISEAPDDFKGANWWSKPLLLGIRQPRNGHETLSSIELSILGEEPSLRPQWWQAYELSRLEVKNRMKNLAQLVTKKPKLTAEVDRIVGEAKSPLVGLYYLPLTAGKSTDDWSVILDAHANVIAYAKFGGFD